MIFTSYTKRVGHEEREKPTPFFSNIVLLPSIISLSSGYFAVSPLLGLT